MSEKIFIVIESYESAFWVCGAYISMSAAEDFVAKQDCPRDFSIEEIALERAEYEPA